MMEIYKHDHVDVTPYAYYFPFLPMKIGNGVQHPVDMYLLFIYLSQILPHTWGQDTIKAQGSLPRQRFEKIVVY